MMHPVVLATALATLVPPAQEASSPASPAEPAAGLFERKHPIEAWGSLMTRLAARGIDLEAFYTLDLLSNVSGGAERTTATVGSLDLIALTDLEALAGWRGTQVLLHAFVIHGGISDAVGDLQGVSNIEGPAAARLYEAWVEQELCDGRASILAGLYELNSDFDVIPAAALFLNGSQGMGAELGNSGRNGPSTFPFTSLAVSVLLRPAETFYARFAALDGVPGDPEETQGTHVELDEGDGLLLIAEVGHLNLPPARLRGRVRRYMDDPQYEELRYGGFGKFAVGLWRYTGRFDDFNDVDGSGDPVQLSASPGLYALGEQRVYYEPDDPLQGLTLFARAGVEDSATNRVDRYLGGGCVYRGLLPGRDADETGFAVAAAHLGSEYRASVEGAEAWEEWEVVLELTHRLRFAPWLSLQPNLQHVIHPGGDPSLDDATVVGVRAVVSF